MPIYFNCKKKKKKPNRSLKSLILPAALIAAALSFSFSFIYNQTSSLKTVKLRSNCTSLSRTEAKRMVTQKGFFDKYWNKSGGFENKYETKKNKNTKIVIDHATNLIWHQSGSNDFMNLNEAMEWINKLNKDKYAGINSWRLPTLEEALSILENHKMNGNLYIDPVFDGWQWCILTGDTLDINKIWLVAFSGRIDWFDSNVRINYVRPVSSM